MKKVETIELPEMDIREIGIKIKGSMPLIVHKFSDKSQKMIEEKQAKKASKAKAARDPKQEYEDALYSISNNGDTGFPANAIKRAMVEAGRQLDVPMTFLRGAFHVLPTHGDLIKIIGKHRMRSDHVRIGQGTADIRYRPEYPKWEMKFIVNYNASSISAEQVINILRQAGYSCGLGDWRPQKSPSGTFGLFEVVN